VAQPPTYVAPDTNFVLHGRPLAEVSPAMLGLGAPFTWLFVKTVVKELDEKTHHTNARIRRRATATLRALEASYTGQSGDLSIERFMPIPALPYADLGFDPHDADDRIRAEIVSFAKANANVCVLLLTLDTGMRMQAHDHGIRLVSPTVELRVAEEEDPDQRELRALRRQLDEIRSAKPDVDLAFEGGSKDVDICVYPPSSDDIVAAIVGAMTVPEDESRVIPSLLGMWRKVPDYAERLETYAVKLRDVLTPLWDVMGRFVRLSISVSNAADVQADDVTLELALPDFAGGVRQIPNKPAIPRKPALYAVTGPTSWAFTSAYDAYKGIGLPSPSVRS